MRPHRSSWRRFSGWRNSVQAKLMWYLLRSNGGNQGTQHLHGGNNRSMKLRVNKPRPWAGSTCAVTMSLSSATGRLLNLGRSGIVCQSSSLPAKKARPSPCRANRPLRPALRVLPRPAGRPYHPPPDIEVAVHEGVACSCYGATRLSCRPSRSSP